MHEQIRIPDRHYWNEKIQKLQSDLTTSTSQRSGPLNQRPNRVVGNLTSNGTVNRTIEEFGELLYDMLFSGKVGNFYDEFLEAHWDKDITVRLCIDHGALGHLPWETLYNRKSKQHFAVSPKRPLVRSAQFEELPITPSDEPLCVLGMAPVNNGVAELDSALERKKIAMALQPLLDQKKAILNWTRSGTYNELMDRLSSPPIGSNSWHIFHFIGHGGYHENDSGSGEGYILINSSADDSDEENMEALYASDLRSILENAPGLRLVVLNSCKGAFSEDGVAFTSSAQRLVLEGVPAVIAMQFEISDKAAILFSSELYRLLAIGQQVQKAITNARLRLKVAGFPEWIAPVLYMRSGTGRLFRDVSIPDRVEEAC